MMVKERGGTLLQERFMMDIRLDYQSYGRTEQYR